MTITYPVGAGLYVNLTNRCPCACTFCIRRNGAGAYGSDSLWLEHEPSTDEVIASIDARRLEDYKEIVFCGYGEPTERLDVLLEVARHIRARAPAMPIRVNTNGLSDLIAAAPTAERLKGLVDTVSISLNAANAEDYVALCRPAFGRAAYAGLLEFAADAKRYVPSVVFTIVRTSDMTSGKIAACQAVCDRLGIPLRVRDYSAPAEGGRENREERE